MRRGRFFWKLFLANAALLAALWIVFIGALYWGIRPTEEAAIPAQTADARLRGLVVVSGLAGLATALALSVGFAVLWNRRIARLTTAAATLARGDLTARLDAAGTDEVALLARALNRLTDRVNAQLSTIDRQRRALEALLGQISEGVIVARGDGRIVLLNPEAKRLLSISHDEPTEPLTVEGCIPQHDLQRLLLPTQTAGEAFEANEVRVDVTTSDGAVSVLARASEIALPDVDAKLNRGGEETIRGRLLVLTDVSELTRAIRLRTDFVANASHELRTPLSAIRGAAETLLQMDFAKEHAAAPRFAEVIARNVARLEALVADLLDLARVESPARLDPTRVYVHRFIDEVQARWTQRAAHKRITFECQVGAECASILTSPRLLGMVLDNLLDNAMKFTDAGGHVSLSVTCNGESAEMTIRDNGCGIAPAEHERVFERFYQASASRTPEGPASERGTGLGLSIVRHAVAAMGGQIRLESALGKGTSVTVTLPSRGDSLDKGDA